MYELPIVLYSASYTLIWIIFFCFGSAQLWTAHFNAVVKYGVRVLCMRASKNRFCEVLRNQGPLTGVSAREIKGMLMDKNGLRHNVGETAPASSSRGE